MHVLVAIAIMLAGILGMISYYLVYIKDALEENTPASQDEPA